MVFGAAHFFHPSMFRLLLTLQFDAFPRKSEEACRIMDFATLPFGGKFEGLGFEPTLLESSKSSVCFDVASLVDIGSLWLFFAFLFR
jgi:hypothetical protein